MKKLFLLLLVVASLSSKAQITLEHTYKGLPFPICLGSSGIKYAQLDTAKIELYNLNHSLFKSIAIPAKVFNTWTGNIFLITQNLFDTDSTTIEYLVDNEDSMGVSSVKVFREDGTMLFKEDSASFLLGGFTASNPITPIWTPIVDTDSGVKMMLVKNYSYKVYSLPGTLPQCASGNPSILLKMGNLQQADGNDLSNYPNPSSGQMTIEYSLPKNVSTGDLIVYSMSGQEMKRYTVTSSYHDIVLNVGELSAGTYYYQLQTGAGIVGGKKMMIVK